MSDATDPRLHAQPDAGDLFVALTTGEYVRQLADSPHIEEHEATWCVAARDKMTDVIAKLLDAREDLDRVASNYAALFTATNALLLGAKDIEERSARLQSEFTLSITGSGVPSSVVPAVDRSWSTPEKAEAS